jgi:hypothetical protein
MPPTNDGAIAKCLSKPALNSRPADRTLVCVLTVLGLFFVFIGVTGYQHRTPAPLPSPVSASFVRYQLAEDDKTLVAVLSVTNSSTNRYRILTADNFITSQCEYKLRNAQGWISWIPPLPKPQRPGEQSFGAFSSSEVSVPLPEPGYTGRVAVICRKPWAGVTGPTNELEKAFLKLWWRLRPPKSEAIKAWCGQELSYAAAEREVGQPQ